MRCYDLTGSNSIVLGQVLQKSKSFRARRFSVVRTFRGLFQLTSERPAYRFLWNLWHLVRHTRA